MDELTPEQLAERAGQLREAARRARELAGSLGGYIDGPVTTATEADPAIWTGPFAEEAGGALMTQQSTMRRMADSLVSDASRWESEAQAMDDEAGSRNEDENGDDEDGGN
jgi:hypothetical protein